MSAPIDGVLLDYSFLTSLMTRVEFHKNSTMGSTSMLYSYVRPRTSSTLYLVPLSLSRCTMMIPVTVQMEGEGVLAVAVPVVLILTILSV